MGEQGSSCCSTGSCGTPADSGNEYTGSESPVIITDKAVEAIKHAISQEGEPGDGLRVSVVGGGCSGYQYNLDFDKEARMGDIELKFDGVTVFVDPISAGYLQGTTIDFVTGLNGTGFKFNNPNAKRTCGCGSSFS
jgi:iron-sulfur cluster assembly protein